MTVDWQNRAALNCDLPSFYINGGGVACTRNLGALAGTVQLGDGGTLATFPTQAFPHGMSFDGANDYLLRAETTDELTFTDPAPFSFDMLCSRDAIQVGSYFGFLCKNGGGAGSSAPYVFYLRNDAGTMKVAWQSVSSGGAVRGVVEVALGSYFPASTIAHACGVYDGTTWRLYFNAMQAFTGVAAGCYAPDAAGQALYVGAYKLGAAALVSFAGMRCYNWGVWPFALQPGEIAQLWRKRLALLQKGV